MIRKTLIILIAAFAAYACAASKKAVDVSIGEWEYVIKDTPEGDVSGTMVIGKDGDSYTGKFVSDIGELPLQNLTIQDGQLNGMFEYTGYEIGVEGKFEGDSFTGKCVVEYMEFPMTATRKK